MKRLLKGLLPAPLVQKARDVRERWTSYAALSYSQEGEDMILRRMFETRKRGFYVDVGAHHPKRFSNTYAFYKRGWTGINVDATPGSMEAFRRFRPRDINVESAVAREAGALTFFQFNEPALNTFDSTLAAARQGGDFHLIARVPIQARTLADLLAAHLPVGRTIDFLTIDVEGLDLDVLQSNDWARFRPRCVLAECLRSSLHEISSDPVFVFLTAQGYELYAKAVQTVIFRDAA